MDQYDDPQTEAMYAKMHQVWLQQRFEYRTNMPSQHRWAALGAGRIVQDLMIEYRVKILREDADPAGEFVADHVDDGWMSYLAGRIEIHESSGESEPTVKPVEVTEGLHDVAGRPTKVHLINRSQYVTDDELAYINKRRTRNAKR